MKLKLSVGRIAILLLPIFGVALFLVLRDLIYQTMLSLPQCAIYQHTGLLCPGCGNTRAVFALANGTILTALQYNITVPFFGVLFALFYAETIGKVFGKEWRLLPRKFAFYGVCIGLFLLYFVLRNLSAFSFLSFL